MRKQTLEENNYNLRKVMNIPGTGPFRTSRRIENEVWAMERNKDYWNKGLPFLDAVEFYHLMAFSPELGSSVLSNRVDYGRILDPVTFRKAQAMPNLSTAKFYQSVIHAVYVFTRARRVFRIIFKHRSCRRFEQAQHCAQHAVLKSAVAGHAERAAEDERHP